jgi:hypothetical protein
MVMIRRELPGTVNADWAGRPYRTEVRRILLAVLRRRFCERRDATMATALPTAHHGSKCTAASQLRLRMRHIRGRTRASVAARHAENSIGSRAPDGLARRPTARAAEAPSPTRCAGYGWPTAPAHSTHSGSLGGARRSIRGGRALGRGCWRAARRRGRAPPPAWHAPKMHSPRRYWRPRVPTTAG